MEPANFQAHWSDQIVLEMWQKWVFLATLVSATCLMRATIGDIVEAGGTELILSILDECRATAEKNGYLPRGDFLDRIRGMLTAKGSPLMPSVLRDIERGARTEADHIVGDLIRRKGASNERSLLEIAYANLKAYEARRTREAGPK